MMDIPHQLSVESLSLIRSRSGNNEVTTMAIPATVERLNFHQVRFCKGRYKSKDDDDISSVIALFCKDYATAVYDDVWKTELKIDLVLRLCSEKLIRSEDAIEHILGVLFQPLVWIYRFYFKCVLPLLEACYYSTKQRGYSCQRYAACLSAAARNPLYKIGNDLLGPVSMCLASEKKGDLPGFTNECNRHLAFFEATSCSTFEKTILSMIPKLMWCEDFVSRNDFSFFKYKASGHCVDSFVSSICNESRLMKQIRRDWSKFVTETKKTVFVHDDDEVIEVVDEDLEVAADAAVPSVVDEEILEVAAVAALPPLPPKDVDKPQIRGWQDLKIGVPLLKCQWCDLAKNFPLEVTQVDCTTLPSGHLIISALQSDANLPMIKKQRCWKEIRAHMKKCYSKRVLRDDETLVCRHLSDPIVWEEDLAPLWKGRKVKYSRADTRNPDGSVKQEFYHEQRKRKIIQDYLDQQNKKSKN